MSELVERYIHEVGRHLPPKERAEIQAELRSQIQDQLEDRFGGAAAQADVVAVLTELGDPRRMAASYAGEQYLVGPALYPGMMMVLRRGWVVVPLIAVVVQVVAALLDETPRGLVGLLVGAALGAAQATFLFSAIVVLLFAILQHSGEELGELRGKEKPFDPRTLPQVDDPAGVDYGEAIFSMVIGTFAALALLYFLRVGGLTLRFDRADPGDVLPVPMPWLVALTGIAFGQVILQLVAALRGRWSRVTAPANFALEVAGAVAVYFAALRPLADHFLARFPQFADTLLWQRWPEITLAVSVVIIAATSGVKLLRVLRGHRHATPAG